SGRQFDFRFFCRFFQALHCQRIVAQVNALIFLEFFNQVVDQTAVEVFTTQVGITVGSQNFEGFFAVNFVDFDNSIMDTITLLVILCPCSLELVLVALMMGSLVDENSPTAGLSKEAKQCHLGLLIVSILFHVAII
ncbi:MAG: hypothetical protein Q619_VDC00347G0001, partial [Veillonella dispar DORA_11]